VLAGHVAFAFITICLLTLTFVEAEVQIAGGDILAVAEAVFP
jgi:hypothetical protein